MKKNNRTLKEMIISNDYCGLSEYSITENDIKDFYDLYCEFESLENDYQQMVLGRKEYAEKIVQKLELLGQFSELINKNINEKRKDKHFYIKSLYIEESFKALEVIKQLANIDGDKYILKSVDYVEHSGGISKHGYHLDGDSYNDTLIILAEESILNEYDLSNKLAWQYNNILKDIYNCGTSMILLGNERRTNVINIENNHKFFASYGKKMRFYLQDDELSKASQAFIDYIEENGSDLKDINIEDLVNVIREKYYNKSKVKSKQRTKIPQRVKTKRI